MHNSGARLPRQTTNNEICLVMNTKDAGGVGNINNGALCVRYKCMFMRQCTCSYSVSSYHDRTVCGRTVSKSGVFYASAIVLTSQEVRYLSLRFKYCIKLSFQLENVKHHNELSSLRGENFTFTHRLDAFPRAAENIFVRLH